MEGSKNREGERGEGASPLPPSLPSGATVDRITDQCRLVAIASGSISSWRRCRTGQKLQTRRFEIEIPRQIISTILAVGPQIKCCIQKKDFIKIAHHSILNIFGPDLQNSPGSLLLGIPTVALPHAQCRSADKILILFTVKCIEFLGWSESRKLGIIPTCRPGRKSIGEVAWVAQAPRHSPATYSRLLSQSVRSFHRV